METAVRGSPVLFWLSLAWAASTCIQVRRPSKAPNRGPAPPRWLAQLAALGAGFEMPSGAPLAFAASVDYAAAAAGIPPRQVAAVASVESAWNPGAVSRAGAIGLMQLMPRTAAELGVNPWDPAASLLGGAMYLRRQLDRFGDVGLALAAYNAGPTRVEALMNGSRPLPAETNLYVKRVLARARSLVARG